MPPAPTAPPEPRTERFCDVVAGLDTVERSGLAPMSKAPVVAESADRLGHKETARWIRQNLRLYTRLFPESDE